VSEGHGERRGGGAGRRGWGGLINRAGRVKTKGTGVQLWPTRSFNWGLIMVEKP